MDDKVVRSIRAAHEAASRRMARAQDEFDAAKAERARLEQAAHALGIDVEQVGAAVVPRDSAVEQVRRFLVERGAEPFTQADLTVVCGPEPGARSRGNYARERLMELGEIVATGESIGRSKAFRAASAEAVPA